MTTSSYNRIAIWGNSGSGKSTLAERLSLELGIPAYHIDRIAWSAGWKYVDEATFLSRLQPWIDQERWIIEGVGCAEGVRRRFARAQLIVYLDTPIELCRERAQRRIDEDRAAPNRFIADGCRYADVVDAQWRVIDHFDAVVRPELEQMIESEFQATPRLQIDGKAMIADSCTAVANRV